MTNKLFIILTFLSFTTSGWGQTNVNEYFSADSKLYLNNNGDTLNLKVIPGQKEINGHLYIIEQEYRLYNRGELLVHEYYYRLDSGNIYVTQDGQKLESLYIPWQPKIGQTWYLSDNGWKWKVVSIDATFSTAAQKFKNLLKIQEFDLEIPEDTGIYFSYFSKGIGLIARTRNGVIEMEYIGQK